LAAPVMTVILFCSLIICWVSLLSQRAN
jgi:hypothetical protein